MKRSELTVAIMKSRGFIPTNFEELDIYDIVANIRNNELWRHFRLTIDKTRVRTEDDFQMCATYRVFYNPEYLEVSEDGNTWYKVAFRWVEKGRKCIYAD